MRRLSETDISEGVAAHCKRRSRSAMCAASITGHVHSRHNRFPCDARHGAGALTSAMRFFLIMEKQLRALTTTSVPLMGEPITQKHGVCLMSAPNSECMCHTHRKALDVRCHQVVDRSFDGDHWKAVECCKLKEGGFSVAVVPAHVWIPHRRRCN